MNPSRLLLLPVLLLLACESAPPSRFHGVVPFSRTEATLGMKAAELRQVQSNVTSKDGGGLLETIGDDEVHYEFGAVADSATADSSLSDDSRLRGIAFLRDVSQDMMTATASWAAAVQEMRTAVGDPRRCGSVDYARATMTVALWSEAGNELMVTLLSDGTSNRLLHSLRQATDSMQLTREIDCP